MLDMLEELEKECLVNDDNEVYRKATWELKRKRGAMV